MVPPATRGRDSNVYSFFAHETAHQWWGHIVLWRSYRDQWLSEGFAEYSGLLYAAKRTRRSGQDDDGTRARHAAVAARNAGDGSRASARAG